MDKFENDFNDKNNNRKNFKRDEREGVVYEPSARGNDEDIQDFGLTRRNRELSRANRKEPQKPHKSQFTLFYIITLIVGVIICIVVFAIFYSQFNKERASAGVASPAPTISALPTDAPAEISEYMQVVGMITKVDISGGELEIIDVQNEKTFLVGIDPTTSIKNKYAQEMVFAELNVGDIIDATFHPKTSVLKDITLDASSWEFKLIKDVKVDVANKFLSIGNDNYFYNDKLIVSRADGIGNVENIAESDLVTLRGYGDKVWYILINKSHGVIEIINKDKIKEGALEIDTTTFTPLMEAENVEVSEGPHKIVVRGANIEPFTKDIIVKNGQTEIIDLATVQYKAGILTFVSSISDYQLFIDEKEYKPTEPVLLDLGVYKIKAKKEGYGDYEATIDLKDPTMEININMEEEVTLRKFSVSTIPEGAEVYIDNGYAGLTPLTELLTDGKHSFTLRKSGYSDFTMTIDVNENARLAYSVNLTKIEGQPDLGAPAPTQQTEIEQPVIESTMP